MTALGWSTAAVLVVLAGLAAIAATRVPTLDRPVRTATLGAELLVVVFVVVDLGLVLAAAPDDRPDSMLTHLGYSVAAVGLVPMLVYRPVEDLEADNEPASLWVLMIALLAVAVSVVRLVQTR